MFWFDYLKKCNILALIFHRSGCSASLLEIDLWFVLKVTEPATEATLVYIQVLEFHFAHRTAIKSLIMPIKHHLRMYCNIQDICLLVIAACFYLCAFVLL